jgi:filamentous hemagglutinin family protein
LAQIAGDNTLGAESTQVQSLGSGAFQIDAGATRGTNLFHSFSQFSVPTNGLAYFNNDPAIQNIISRVIGPASIIDGTLLANGTANLFLINPNGISFGQNAQLNLGGSFFASTASSILFADGTQFSATPPQATPLLTVSVPLGLQYGSNPGNIQVQGSTLEVNTGQTLALVGGNVELNGGILRAPGGRIEIGGLTGAGTVQLDVNGNNLPLSFPDGVARGDVTLSNTAVVDVVAGADGDIAINARNINISGKSNVCAGIGTAGSSCNSPESDSGADDSVAGNIIFDATGAVSISNSRIENNLNPDATGNSGNIFEAIANNILFGSILINAGSVALTDGAQVDTSSYGTGSAGIVSVQANGQVSLDNSNLASAVYSSDRGDAGGILIEGGSISLSGAEVDTTNLGSGNPGPIMIRASDQVSIANSGLVSKSLNLDENEVNSGYGSIQVQATQGSVVLNQSTLTTDNIGSSGYAGDISISAGDQVSILNQSQISSQGDYGRIFIGASEQYASFSLRTVTIDNATLSTTNVGSGNAGQISIEAGSISLSGAQVDTNNLGSGVAGNITIRASEQDLIANNSNISSTSKNAIADPDNFPFIQLEATQGSVSLNQSTVSTTNSGSNDGFGWAGDVVISARDQVSILNGSNISSNGNSGRILIGKSEPYPDVATPRVVKIDSSTVQTDDGIPNVFQSGVAGYINIVSSDSIRLSNQARITADTSGEGGNINLESPLIVLRGNGKLPQDTLISTNADGLNSPGGNINITTTFLVGVPKENSDITANSTQARGGQVFIDVSAGGIYGLQFRQKLTPRSDITAKGRDASLTGTVSIYTSGIDPEKGLAELPVTVTDPSNQIVTGCAAARGNSFTVTGRGGLPEDPTATIRGQTVWRDLQDFSQGTGVVKAPPQNPQALIGKSTPRLVEANSWIYDDKGNVVLVATQGNGTSSTYRSKQPDCQDLLSWEAQNN